MASVAEPRCYVKTFDYWKALQKHDDQVQVAA
jgi:hypothetical protein